MDGAIGPARSSLPAIASSLRFGCSADCRRPRPVARPSLPGVLAGVCAYTDSRVQLLPAPLSRFGQIHVCVYTHVENASGGRGVSRRRSTMRGSADLDRECRAWQDVGRKSRRVIATQRRAARDRQPSRRPSRGAWSVGFEPHLDSRTVSQQGRVRRALRGRVR
jgi:hypothetical protein